LLLSLVEALCLESFCSCFDILRQIRCIRRSLPRSSLATLITAFILSEVDYCNVALSGLSNRDLERVQSVINAGASLTTGARKYDHVTPLLKDSHWLCISECVTYKLCVLVYKGALKMQDVKMQS